MEGPVCTLFDLYRLLETRPVLAIIRAEKGSAEMFRTLGQLAGFRGIFLDRLVANGAVCIVGRHIAIGMDSIKTQARMKHLVIKWE